jgi:hypothetical protein
MADFIIWYSVDIFLIALLVIAIIITAAAVRVIRRRHHADPDFDYIEVLE